MNSFDIFFWALAALLVAGILDLDPGSAGHRATRLWLFLGAVLGLGLLNKISVLWLGLGLFAGLVLTPARRWLRTGGPWLAGAIAALLFLPHVLWQALNGWPTVEFMRNATQTKYKAFPSRPSSRKSFSTSISSPRRCGSRAFSGFSWRGTAGGSAPSGSSGP